MALRPTKKQRINDLLEPYGKQIQDAFNAAIIDITSQADLARIIAALSAGDIDGALVGLHINASAFVQFNQALAQSFQAGGTTAISALPAITAADGTRLVFRFNGSQGAAQAYLQQYSGTMIQGIVNDQLAMARDIMSTGLGAGKGPAAIGLDLVGKINPATGLRQGGTIGISQYGATLVQNAKEELASGDPAQLRNYLTRQLRDQRFDRSVDKFLADPTKVIPDDIQQAMVNSYQNRMIQLRGESIGRTEALRSLHAGQHIAYQQAVEQGQLNPNQLRRVWVTASDGRVRDSHASMEGQSVGLDEPFITGDGVSIMYPGDPSAPIEEVAGCRCDVDSRIDFLANIA